jgi:hypothetical protein
MTASSETDTDSIGKYFRPDREGTGSSFESEDKYRDSGNSKFTFQDEFDDNEISLKERRNSEPITYHKSSSKAPNNENDGGIRGFYTGRYKDKNGKKTTELRYGNGRFSKTTFIVLNVILGITLFNVFIVTPVMYVWGVPWLIQYMLNHPPTTEPTPESTMKSVAFLKNNVHLDDLAIGSFQNNEIGIHFKATIQQQVPSFLAVHLGMGNLNINIYNIDPKTGQENLIVDQFIPDTQFWINAPIVLDLNPKIVFTNTNIPGMQSFLSKLVGNFESNTQPSAKDINFIARFNLNAKFYGFSIYRALPLYLNIAGEDILAALNKKPKFNTLDYVSLKELLTPILIPDNQLGNFIFTCTNSNPLI